MKCDIFAHLYVMVRSLLNEFARAYFSVFGATIEV